jgi:hypothetical protein
MRKTVEQRRAEDERRAIERGEVWRVVWSEEFHFFAYHRSEEEARANVARMEGDKIELPMAYYDNRGADPTVRKVSIERLEGRRWVEVEAFPAYVVGWKPFDDRR